MFSGRELDQRNLGPKFGPIPNVKKYVFFPNSRWKIPNLTKSVWSKKIAVMSVAKCIKMLRKYTIIPFFFFFNQQVFLEQHSTPFRNDLFILLPEYRCPGFYTSCFRNARVTLSRRIEKRLLPYDFVFPVCVANIALVNCISVNFAPRNKEYSLMLSLNEKSRTYFDGSFGFVFRTQMDFCRFFSTMPSCIIMYRWCLYGAPDD